MAATHLATRKREQTLIQSGYELMSQVKFDSMSYPSCFESVLIFLILYFTSTSPSMGVITIITLSNVLSNRIKLSYGIAYQYP